MSSIGMCSVRTMEGFDVLDGVDLVCFESECVSRSLRQRCVHKGCEIQRDGEIVIKSVI